MVRDDAQLKLQRRNVAITAVVLALVALGFYLGFIVTWL